MALILLGINHFLWDTVDRKLDSKLNKKEDSINKLPPEVLIKIFDCLDITSKTKANQVCTSWNVLTDEELKPTNKELIPIKKVFLKNVLGPNAWLQHFGERALDEDDRKEAAETFDIQKIYNFLNQPCDIFPGKQRWETRIVAWMPKKLHGKPLSQFTIGDAMKKCFPEIKGCEYSNTAYTYYSKGEHPVYQQLDEKKIKKSKVGIMTRELIPGTRRMTYEEMEESIQSLSERSLIPYTLSPTLEGTVCVFANYILKKEYTCGKKSETRMLCKETWEGPDQWEPYELPPEFRSEVGEFSAEGLRIKTGYSEEQAHLLQFESYDKVGATAFFSLDELQ